jgi:hypothetical protein
MLGHHQPWEYGWSFFNLAIQEANEFLKPTNGKK